MSSSQSRQLEWSPKHTRLRYQAVVSGIIFVSVCYFQVRSFSVPGFFKFEGDPPYSLIWLATISFFVFSIYAFKVQTDVESKITKVPMGVVFSEFRELLENSATEILEKWPDFQSSKFMRASNSLLPKRSPAGKFQPLADIQHNKYVIQIRNQLIEVLVWKEDAGKKLTLLKANFLAIKPNLEMISGEQFLNLSRLETIISEIASIHSLISESITKVNASFDEFLDAKESYLDINFRPDQSKREELNRTAVVLESQLTAVKTSLPLINSIGSTIADFTATNIAKYEMSSEILAAKIPFYFSLGLLGLGLILSLNNILIHWAIL